MANESNENEVVQENELTTLGQMRRLAQNAALNLAEIAVMMQALNTAISDLESPTVMTGATDEAGGTAGLVPAPIAGQEEYFLKGNGSWAIPSGGGGGASNYRQITKTNVTASASSPKTVNITIPRTTAFRFGTPNALLFVAGETGVVETACGFDNGDAGDFNYPQKYVGFDGTMHLNTEYAVDMGTPAAFGSGYLSTSETINISEYKDVEAVKAGGGKAVGIALVASGGGSGTWARFEENATALLLTDGAAYDCAGNLMAANWTNLTNAEKIAAFANAEGADLVPTTLHFTHDITMGTPAVLGSGYISTSATIDTSNYSSVEGAKVGSSKAVGIALVASGGGSGTWARFEEKSTAILIASTGAAYDCNGNLLAADWANLTDAEKEALFASATGETPGNIMETLGTFQFAVYSVNNAQAFCKIYEAEALSSINVLVYAVDDTAQSCTITAVPKDQIVKPSGLISLADYDAINTVAMAASTSGNAAIRYAVTPDLSTYYTYDAENSEWAAVAATAAGVMASGMTATEIAAVPAEAWAVLAGAEEKLGFAYALSMTDTAEDCYVDAMTLDVDMKGDWRAAVYGTEYTYAYTNNVNLQFLLYASGNWKINYDAGA